MAKDKAATPVLETGMLSFARSLQPSEGLFWGLRSSQPDWRAPVEVIERGVRGQSSEANTKNPGKSNPQVVEAASVPLGCDGIELAFSLWVAPKAPSRVYAKLPRQMGDRTVQQASMHSQKIGAALRHIDIWHGNSEHSAIAVNPYGGVQETGQVLRDSKGAGGAKSFYALRGNPKALFDGIQAAGGSNDIPADVHFVVANLVRGGVFGQKADS